MTQKSQVTYLKDYKRPDYKVESVVLDFTLKEANTNVYSRLKIIPDYDTSSEVKPLFLNGEDIKLQSIKLNGKSLDSKDYKVTDEGLTILNPPKDAFLLELEVFNNPKSNTKLMGLYMSNGIYCTQCEPQGFRRITYYFDHPDVMSKFKVIIRADKNKYPVRLSNGNLIEETDDYVVWEDPFAKPCYLFALVVADYGFIEDHFTTMSGKDVKLRIYAEHGKESRLYHAMASLKRAFKWDEDAFGREYDLTSFNVVAVHDFNAGAMENKSLNIFNEKALLADTLTSTDADYYHIEGVIGHEYFHNWSGDRVTARDWFNLSLKEGLTVYRDSEFSADMNSRPVKRINDVIYLRGIQFPEDAGPLAHPVRPESYIEIDNFYTVTIYEKGAEVIRMQEKILGKAEFRKAMDLYFSRHDGQAVTIDDFVQCMQDSSGIDLTQFKRWYSQAGTPHVTVKSSYDSEKQALRLTLSQHTDPTPNQPTKEPFVIPMEVGFLGADGKDMIESKVLLLKEPTQEFTFEHIPEKPVLSLNRGFTAPIILSYDYSDSELAFLMANDSDAFNRWEAGQSYALKYILALYEALNDNQSLTVNDGFFTAFGSYLDIQDDKAFAALALRLPTLKFIANYLDQVDFTRLYQVLQFIKKTFAQRFKAQLLDVYNANQVENPMDISSDAAAKRALRNQALAYLAILGENDTNALVVNHYQTAGNMTDIIAALGLLTCYGIDGYKESLDVFYHKYGKDPIVITKWLVVQALSERDDTLATVEKISKSDAFDIFNPNNIYSLIIGFATNLPQFNRPDGKGYEFIGDKVIELDNINPMVAAKVAKSFLHYPKLVKGQKQLMHKVLTKIMQKSDLSPNVYEIISNILAD